MKYFQMKMGTND